MIQDYDLSEKRKEGWELKKIGGQLVPGVIYGDDQIIQHLGDDVKAGKEWNALRQSRNVAFLPGIQKALGAVRSVSDCRRQHSQDHYALP